MREHLFFKDLVRKLLAVILFMLIYMVKSAIKEYIFKTLIVGFWTLLILELVLNIGLGIAIGLFFQGNIQIEGKTYQHITTIGLLFVLALTCKFLIFTSVVGLHWSSALSNVALYPQLALGMYLLFYGKMLWQKNKQV